MKKKLHLAHPGQTLVEFALMLPAFLLLAVVIFDLGRGVYYYNAIHNAAREGVRYGAVNPSVNGNVVTYDETGMKNTAINFAVGLGLTSDDITHAGWGPDEIIDGYANKTVEVIINYSFTPVTPFVANFLPCGCGHFTLAGDAIMRTEWLPKQ